MSVTFVEINHIIEVVFLVILFVIVFSYAVLAIVSIAAMRKHHRKDRAHSVEDLISSKYLPSISIIAPAYNEGLTIVENVRSILSLNYSDFEIVIVNDGSKDDSLQKLIEAFSLAKVRSMPIADIPTQTVRGVYKSRNLAYSHLIVVDKENGGKADALNAGINQATKKLVLCIDVDCIIEPDGLLKMVRPFLEESKKKVVAVGGVIRVVNSCEVKSGKVTQVNLPNGWLERFQVLEYFRVFTLNRMGWAHMRGMLLISGALGLFDKEIVVRAGGYTPNIVGEDMELVLKLHQYMREVAKEKYTIGFIPDPLCWTEVPNTTRVLSRQRNRWSRGFIESILKHKRIFLNPKYGFVGLISFPYAVFFEWLVAPIEVFGYAYLLYSIYGGNFNLPFFLLLFILVYSYFMMVTLLAILAEELVYHRYNKKMDLVKLMLIAMIEPFFYHPLNLYWTIKGNFDYFIRGKREWGKMDRRGFDENII
ncbi:glycosyltransferase [uncultured Acetobacteroides sp.]|uniref:glycosyltransferase family 2 protein n=1 Tax=uncultured Acetobacteroides sp. TaxID=1760811 RepID=UPI0029F4E344|nr:glycosyltransferase [uncultured Acetobacteroides sp.]